MSRDRSHLDWAEITVTGRCNQQCFFCYEEAREHSLEPDLLHIKALIEAASEQVRLVVLCGKEALLRPDIDKIIEHASSLGLEISTFTNGRVLAREGFVERLAKAGLRSLQISFHFPDERAYARGTRTTEKGFERLLRGLEKVREHNTAQPQSRINVFSETDMFFMNSGRLDEIREILMRRLGPALSGMRLGCLLPTDIQDIGVAHVLEPLEERRRELDRFIASHPRSLPLEFVKIPLCLIPGQEHLAKGVAYLSEGTLLTHNHEALDRISVDVDSTSSTRELLGRLRRFPYRWICRSCPLVGMCRFERVEWGRRFFEPTRAQRPISSHDTTARSIMEKVCTHRVQAIADVERKTRALGEAPFPEEEIIRAISEKTTESMVLVDVSVEGAPILDITLQKNESTIALHLRPPTLASSKVGWILGYLNVGAIAGDSISESDLRSCLRMLSRIELPALERWVDEPWFDMSVARLFYAVWSCLGDRAWPEIGSFGDWNVVAAEVHDGPELRLTIEHEESLASSEIRLRESIQKRGEKTEAPLMAAVIDDDSSAQPEHFDGLLQAVGAVMGFPIKQTKRGNRVFRFNSGRWDELQDIDLREVDAIELVFREATEPEGELRFWISHHREWQPFFSRIGDLTLTYGAREMTPELLAISKVVEVAMKVGQDLSISEQSLSEWKALLGDVLSKTSLEDRYAWDIRWSSQRTDLWSVRST